MNAYEDDEEEIKEDWPLQTESLARRLTGAAVKSYTFDSKPVKNMKRMRSQTSAKDDYLGMDYMKIAGTTKAGLTMLFESQNQMDKNN